MTSPNYNVININGYDGNTFVILFQKQRILILRLNISHILSSWTSLACHCVEACFKLGLFKNTQPA